MIGIYKITSPTKKVYIGQSVNIEKRFKTYELLRCKSQPIIYNSLKKYGFDKHKFEILCECDIEELNNKERYYQDAFSSTGKNGMNCRLTASSDRSGKLSEEHKRKINEWKKNISDKTKIKMSESVKGNKNHFYGKKHSEESKLKMSESLKGRIYSKESKIKMSDWQKKIILNTETGIFYFGAKEASESINIKIHTLRSQLQKQNPNKTSFIYV